MEETKEPRYEIQEEKKIDTKGSDRDLQLSERAIRQQNRLLKAAKTGKELNDSYYDEVDSDNQ